MKEHINAMPDTTLSRRLFLGGSAVAALSLFIDPSEAFGVTAAEKQAEADAALASLNAMQEQLGIAEDNYHTAVAEQEAAQGKMDEAQARIDEVSGEISELQGRLGARARSMYRSGSATFIDFLLGASSFQEFTQNWNLLQQVNQQDADMVQEMKDLRAEVEAQKAEYAAQEQIAADKAAEALSIKEEAEATVASMQAVYDNLSAEAARLLEEERIAREQAAAEEARRRAEEAARAEAEAEANRRPSNNGGGNSGGGSGNSSSGGSSGSTPPYNAVTGNAVADRAISYIGNASYVWAACSPGKFDCSGFVSYCLTGEYRRVGSTSTFMKWPRVSNPQPGDVCTNNGHCGIYIGGGQMVHASNPRVGVIQSAVYSSMIFVRPPW